MSKEEIKPTYDGIVMYADGSFMPPNGKLGAGIHGYTYSSVEPKKGAGAAKDVLTSIGYVPKATKDAVKQVTPLNYIDIIAPIEGDGNNNTAELYAASIAIENCIKYQTSHEHQPSVLVYTDSMYVVDGLNKHAPKWMANNWRKADGTDVKNRPLWERLIASVNSFSKVEVKWIKGHAEHLGNVMADKLADISRIKSENDNYEHDVRESVPEGYWKKETDRHPLLALRGAFFYTSESNPKPGEYFLTNKVKSDEFIGLADSETSVGVIQLKAADRTIEHIKTRHKSFPELFNTLIMIRLDRIFQGQKADELDRYGQYCLTKGKRPGAVDLYFTGETSRSDDPTAGTPITEMLYPQMLASRISNHTGDLQVLLREYIETKEIKGDDTVIVDVTKVFLAKGAKGWDFTPEVKNENTVVRIQTEAFGQTFQVPLTFGVDLINKNNIRKLSLEGEIAVKLVLVKENEELLRYHVLIENGLEYSIWSGCFANQLFFCKMKKPA